MLGNSKPVDDPKRMKVRLGVLVGVIAIGLIWIAINLLGSPMFKSRAREPDSPQWTAARQHTSQLRQDPLFADVDIIPADDDPARFKVVGSVRTRQNLDALSGRLAELLPAGRFDTDVMVLDPDSR